jgi:DNA-binding transcriptional MerR regulator
MSRRQVAYLFRVTSAAVAKWARRGLLPEIRDEDGRPRYRPADVEALRRSGRWRGARAGYRVRITPEPVAAGHLPAVRAAGTQPDAAKRK